MSASRQQAMREQVNASVADRAGAVAGSAAQAVAGGSMSLLNSPPPQELLDIIAAVNFSQARNTRCLSDKKYDLYTKALLALERPYLADSAPFFAEFSGRKLSYLKESLKSFCFRVIEGPGATASSASAGAGGAASSGSSSAAAAPAASAAVAVGPSAAAQAVVAGSGPVVNATSDATDIASLPGLGPRRLFKMEKKKNGSEQTLVFLEVVPPRDWYRVIALAHQRVAHAGILATFSVISRTYDNVPRTAVQAVINNCPVCHTKKWITNRTRQRQMVVRGFMSRVFLEVFEVNYGPGPRHVVHVRELTRRYSFLRPLTSKDPASVAEAVVQIFFDFGEPHVLHTELPLEFTTEMVRRLMELMNTTLVYNRQLPPTGGDSIKPAVDAAMATWITDSAARRAEWVRYLPMVQLSLNRRKPPGDLHLTPYEFTFGRRNTGLPDVPFDPRNVMDEEQLRTAYSIVVAPSEGALEGEGKVPAGAGTSITGAAPSVRAVNSSGSGGASGSAAAPLTAIALPQGVPGLSLPQGSVRPAQAVAVASVAKGEPAPRRRARSPLPADGAAKGDGGDESDDQDGDAADGSSAPPGTRVKRLRPART
jgi:hypothetical protein